MLQALIPLLGTVLDKIIPDPTAAADAKLKAFELAQKGELAALDADVRLALGQMDINKAEATTDLFRGGWRPAVGWVCVAGLGYQLVLRPLLPWIVRVAGGTVPDLPSIDTDTLMILLTGMLGLGGMRTLERLRGRA
jgi:roadblock/LC7 domain-containing protein